ncbi:uncharacterized protein LOC128271205 [Anopheles cruzii]|uniref:uncharacterized protein LOC128271205 n=1 Tax=Anopheles cruzii TaxID=68878 RepID=UPI0022EC5241|nr:uncharacterized protein LOC128271205 [Anopheles cruzii]
MAAKASTPLPWQRGEILEMLCIVRTSGIEFLNGTRSNQNGELFQHIAQRLKVVDKFVHRDAAQIEGKWKVLKRVYDRIKTGDRKLSSLRPFEFYTEMDEILQLAVKRSTIDMATVQLMGVESLAPEAFYTIANRRLVATEDTEDTEDELITDGGDTVFDLQNEMELAESGAQPQRTTRPKKLTPENRQELMDKVAEMQKKHQQEFNRKQMEVIETEFETFRAMEKDVLLQLKLDMEVLKEKCLERIVEVARGETTPADVLEGVMPGATTLNCKRRKKTHRKRN